MVTTVTGVISLRNTNLPPKISVCIPVFDTEPLLAECLRSVIHQDFPAFEVIVVSDASTGKDEKGRSAKKVVKLLQKECDRLRKLQNLPQVKIKFFEHKENRGLVEVRRTLCYEASGEYIAMLDSDDALEEGALSALYSASGMQADIIHGTSTAGTYDENGSFIPAKENRYGKIFYGSLKGHEIFRSWLIDGKLTANTWGKLIRRVVFIKAFENIPYTECNMAEDVLLFFFISQIAKSYIGIEQKVYRYRINSGMSGSRQIDNLQKWKMICSTASVFAIILQFPIIEGADSQILTDEVEYLRGMARYYLLNNIKQMHAKVPPVLQDEVRSLLCEYWGQDFVQIVEKTLKL